MQACLIVPCCKVFNGASFLNVQVSWVEFIPHTPDASAVMLYMDEEPRPYPYHSMSCQDIKLLKQVQTDYFYFFYQKIMNAIDPMAQCWVEVGLCFCLSLTYLVARNCYQVDYFMIVQHMM